MFVIAYILIDLTFSFLQQGGNLSTQEVDDEIATIQQKMSDDFVA